MYVGLRVAAKSERVKSVGKRKLLHFWLQPLSLSLSLSLSPLSAPLPFSPSHRLFSSRQHHCAFIVSIILEPTPCVCYYASRDNVEKAYTLFPRNYTIASAGKERKRRGRERKRKRKRKRERERGERSLTFLVTTPLFPMHRDPLFSCSVIADVFLIGVRLIAK